MKDKYINLFTDFGFNRAFGKEAGNEYLISFLNTLLPEHHQIKILEFSHVEHEAATPLDHQGLLDLCCRNENGEEFFVQLQKVKLNYYNFAERSLFHSILPIQGQSQHPAWDFKLAPVYTIGVLDFVLGSSHPSSYLDVVHQVQLKNQSNHVFSDKLTFIYLNLPNFAKSKDQLESMQDKWLYLFRHLHELEERPACFQEPEFVRLFEQVNINRFQPEEQQAYEASLKYYRDLKNVIDTARHEGRKQGLTEKS